MGVCTRCMYLAPVELNARFIFAVTVCTENLPQLTQALYHPTQIILTQIIGIIMK